MHHVAVDQLDLFAYCEFIYACIAEAPEDIEERMQAIDKELRIPPWPDRETWGMTEDAQAGMQAMMALGGENGGMARRRPKKQPAQEGESSPSSVPPTSESPPTLPPSLEK